MMKNSILALSILFLAGCSAYQPLKTASYVDLERFMGKWYVVANIPTFIEKDAYNAVEIYDQQADGSIATTFRFNKGSFNGEVVEYHPVGRVLDDSSNAIWEMQFIWPFKADYRVMHVDEGYSSTIIGRTKRDYVWIMSRTPEMSGQEFKKLLDIIHQQGYDTKQVQRVPHQAEKPKELAWRT